MSKLKLGLIPQRTECPFVDRCAVKQDGHCNHQGENHACDYSCALARGFDLIETYNKNVKPIV